MQVIETKRLILRLPKPSDLVSFFYYASKPNIGISAGWHPHRNLDDTKSILDMFIKEKNIWAITLKQDDVMIGSIGLEDRQFNHVDGEGCDLGYVLDDTYWNQGIMTEAVKEVIKYVFMTLKFDYLTVNHIDSNLGSMRVIEKNKFRYLNSMKKQYLDDQMETFKYYILTKRGYLGYETTTINEI